MPGVFSGKVIFVAQSGRPSARPAPEPGVCPPVRSPGVTPRMSWVSTLPGLVQFGLLKAMTNENSTEALDELSEELTIVNPLGLHARPAAALVQTVLQFKSDVYISLNGHRVNAKSIMGLLTLAAACGSVLTFTYKGSDARQAMDAVRSLIESGFGEV